MTLGVVARPEEVHDGLMPKHLVCLTEQDSSRESAPAPALRANPKRHTGRFKTPSIADRLIAYLRLSPFAEEFLAAPPGSQVYFIGPEAGGGPVKIGWSIAVQARLADLQRGSPVKLCILAVVDGGRGLEREYHSHFAKHRLHGEWFTLTNEMKQEIKRHAW